MRFFPPGRALALTAGASFAFAASMASAQDLAPPPAPTDAEIQAEMDAQGQAEFEAQVPAEPQPGDEFAQDAQFQEPRMAASPELAQIIPPDCFDAAGSFSVDMNPAVCGVFEGAPGTEGGIGPTGTITQTETQPGVPMEAPADGMAAAPSPPDAPAQAEQTPVEDEEWLIEEETPPGAPQTGY